MSRKKKEEQWFEKQTEISGIVTRAKKHYFKHETLSSIFRPLPIIVDYEALLQESQGNQELVEAVKKFVTETYFDAEGQPKEYGSIYRVGIYFAPKREFSIPDPNAKDWINVVFDNDHSVHMISGPVGHDYVITSFHMNKSFLYSMSKML